MKSSKSNKKCQIGKLLKIFLKYGISCLLHFQKRENDEKFEELEHDLN